jgi:superfamily II DNA/RNA helicase
MSFNDFKLHPKINANIDSCGYTQPTPIQTKAIPPILAGQDVLGLAQTGTGKTAAFVLPIVQHLLTGQRKTVRALIVAPTRELAEQIHENVTTLAAKTGIRSVVVYGGVGKQPQIRAIRSGAEIIVACPGRLLDILTEKDINLRNVETFVLDEADHMFDKGFLPDIRRIVKQLPHKRQSLVFSATMPKAIRHLVEDILTDPCTLQIDHSAPALTISHTLIRVAREQKTSLLKQMLQEKEMTSTVVFTRTKHKARSLAQQLERSGHRAVSLQGNLSQQKRRIAMDGFRNGTFSVLVATDIAARGIDVSNISHVVNYDVPDTAETYTHRTGRTGRAKQSGQAVTFADRGDQVMISQIERILGKKMNQRPLNQIIKVQELNKESRKTVASIKNTGAPRQKNNNSRNKNTRNKSVSFDFGINTSS